MTEIPHTRYGERAAVPLEETMGRERGIVRSDDRYR